jgi:drug/metabolite transporter (DMT)-like permease
VNDKRKGLFWIICWCVAFTCGVSISKLLSSSTNNLSLFCVRYLTGFFFFLPVFIPHLKPLPKFKAGIKLHILRAVCIGCSTLLTYQTYRHLPLAVATTIGFTGPLLAASFGIIFLKEKPSIAKAVALISGYLGVIFIVQPGYIPFNFYILTGLGMCTLASIANTLARYISNYDTPIIIMISSTVILATVALFGALFGPTNIAANDLKLLIMVGMFGSFSQFSYIKAVSSADVSYVAPFEYTRLLLVVPIGYFFFQEVINLGQWLGMCLIVIGSIYLSKKG